MKMQHRHYHLARKLKTSFCIVRLIKFNLKTSLDEEEYIKDFAFITFSNIVLKQAILFASDSTFR